MSSTNSTIKLKLSTLEELRSYGKMGDHWDDVVQRLLKRHNDDFDTIQACLKQIVEYKNKVAEFNQDKKDTEFNEFNEVVVPENGRVRLGKESGGKTIEWREKKE